jgi:hypothetical protein
MKVKISYTIDFDELPAKVRVLAQETLNALSSEISSILVNKQFLDMDETESKMEIISKIQTFRQSLMKYDMQLADYVNLLANYEKARLDVMTVEDGAEQEEGGNESG